MTKTDINIQPNDTQPKPAGFFRDLMTMTSRSVRAMSREPEYLVPSIIIPVFFFAVNVGSLETVGSAIGTGDFKAFQLPVAIVLAVTGISRATALVTDIQSGFFDRLLVSPVNRYSLLLGLMMADFILVLSLSVLVVLMGLLLGVEFVTGIAGILVFLLFSGLWGLAFTGFPYAIALKTGSTAAVSASFLLFFPFSFLTTAYVPKEFLSGWLKVVAEYNPVTYLLDGLRVLITTGWELEKLLYMFLAISLVGLISFGLAFSALVGRLKQR
ncbi:MAG: ABC transporter permease [Patescibacteria group bacterium]